MFAKFWRLTVLGSKCNRRINKGAFFFSNSLTYLQNSALILTSSIYYERGTFLIRFPLLQAFDSLGWFMVLITNENLPEIYLKFRFERHCETSALRILFQQSICCIMWSVNWLSNLEEHSIRAFSKASQVLYPVPALTIIFGAKKLILFENHRLTALDELWWAWNIPSTVLFINSWISDELFSPAENTFYSYLESTTGHWFRKVGVNGSGLGRVFGQAASSIIHEHHLIGIRTVQKWTVKI